MSKNWRRRCCAADSQRRSCGRRKNIAEREAPTYGSRSRAARKRVRRSFSKSIGSPSLRWVKSRANLWALTSTPRNWSARPAAGGLQTDRRAARAADSDLGERAGGAWE